MLSIVVGTDNPILRTKSTPVVRVTKDVSKLLDRMWETLDIEKNGVGLAAPQVGQNVRVIILLLVQKHRGKYVPREMINPVITFPSNVKEIDIEGCLSVPGQFGKVERYQEINVQFLDRKGHSVKLNFLGFNARVIQHEVDHLDGILFVDRVIEFVTLDKEDEIRV